MKTMKLNFKVLMAMLVFCMPLVLTACGDDDDDDSPKTYSYTWTIDYSTPSSWTSEQKRAALDAESSVNQAFATNLQTTAEAVVNTNSQEFTITGGEKSDNDKRVKSSLLLTTANLSKDVANVFPNNTKITVKRGNTKVCSENLK